MNNNDSYKRTSSINSSLLFFSNQTVNFNDKLLNISDKRLEKSSLITINNTDNNTITHKTTTTTKNQTSTTASVSSIEENKITILQCDHHDTDRHQSLESSPSSTSLSSPLLSSFETIFNQRYRQSLSQHQQSSSESRLTTLSTLAATKLPSKMMLGNGVVPPGLLPPLDHYRLQLYNYAMVERLRCSQYHSTGSIPICPSGYPNTAAAAAAAVNNPYGSRLALSMSLFHNRVFQPEEPKPQHSYIGLIAMAILSSPESKLVLSDIYQHILDNYPYFRTRGPGWRNSIRHNLSLNDCFIKAGRSANGKGHYWAIHPANLEDFKKGDFRRRKAQRKVRKHMGLAVDDEGTDSPSPPALAVTPPPHHSNVVGSPFCPNSWTAAAVVASGVPAAGVMANMYSQSSRKRQFDVASLLAPDEDSSYHSATRYLHNNHIFLKGPAPKRLSYSNPNEIDEYIDVVANDVEDNIRQISNKTNNTSKQQYEDNKQFINNVPPIRSLTTFTVENRSFSREEDREIQSASDEINTESPISNHVDDDNIEPNTAPSSPTTWQGFIQQWPNNFHSFGTNNGPMDPRILGRYYGQYMAAAAAQQMAASRRAIAVGNLLNQVNSEDNNIVVNINNNNPDSQIITSQNDNKNNDSDNCNNENNFTANETHNKKDDIMELYRNQHLQHQHHHQQQQQPNQSQHQHENHFQQNQNSNNLLNIQTSDC